MSEVSRSDRAWARSASSGMPVITPPTIVVERSVEACLLAACRREELQVPPISLQPHLPARFRPLRFAIAKPPFPYYRTRHRLVRHAERPPARLPESRTISRRCRPRGKRSSSTTDRSSWSAGRLPTELRAPPVPSVSDRRRSQLLAGDHGYSDAAGRMGLLLPGHLAVQRARPVQPTRTGLDLTFDITFVPPTPAPCRSPSPSPSGSSGTPSPAQASPCPGDFGFMIISTYQRGDAGRSRQLVRPPTSSRRPRWRRSAGGTRSRRRGWQTAGGSP